MKRICVVGASGAGKSTLSRQLGERLGLPVFHMDQMQWGPGWVELEEATLVHQLEDALAQPTWVIDGNYNRSLDLRLSCADTVIWLDLPPRIYRWRVFKRTVLGWRRTRADMTPGCPERLDLPFLRYVWNFHRDNRPRLRERLQKASAGTTVITLTSRRAVRGFCKGLENTPRANAFSQ